MSSLSEYVVGILDVDDSALCTLSKSSKLFVGCTVGLGVVVVVVVVEVVVGFGVVVVVLDIGGLVLRTGLGVVLTAPSSRFCCKDRG